MKSEGSVERGEKGTERDKRKRDGESVLGGVNGSVESHHHSPSS